MMSARLSVTTLVAALLVALVSSVGLAQEQPFVHRDTERAADRYEAYLKESWKPGDRRAEDLLREGKQRLAGGDARAATQSLARAVVADRRNAAAWAELARALLAITPNPKSSERYELPTNGSAAAYRAYQVATGKAEKAEALVLLSEALKRRSFWRPAIDALKTSLALHERSDVRAAYEKLRAERGFRIADYKIDSDAAEPRLCIRFSERLATSVADFAKFISVDGRDPQGVTAEASQICVEGLKHGQRYEVLVRAGLPSSVGEALPKSAPLAVYVRDRSASVRFTGRSYVLPNRGQQGIPVVTVNTDRLAVRLFRIGDRGVAGALQGGNFQGQLSRYQLEELKDRSASLIYSGEMATRIDLNKEVSTAFPLSVAVPKLGPGLYVMVAEPVAGKRDETLATQWFVVSDLGLTSFSGADGIHVFVRSLATAEPRAVVDVRLVARNNEVLAEGKTDARGYVRFDAGLRRGEGGLAPAILVAEGGGGDYAFLDLSAAGFDLTDRGVKGRETPGAVDGYIYSERGIYRPGETAHLTALVRDRAGVAVTSLPVTLIVTRPDGVEHMRVVLADQGNGGRTHALRLATSAMTGTWRAKVYTDPKAAPVAQVAFLVEDFVPERLALELAAKTPAFVTGEPGRIEVTGRYLYGPPAAGLAIEGEIVVRPAKAEVPGFAGYRFGQDGERVQPVRAALQGLGATDANGKAQLAVKLPAVPRTDRPLEAQVIVKLREPGGRTIERSLVVPVDLRQPRIGIKPLFKGNALGDGETAAFDVVMLGANGRAQPAPKLTWELLRIHQSYQWYKRNGSWAYEAVTFTRRVASGETSARDGLPGRIAAKLATGRYRLEVTTGAAGGPVASLGFTSGWWASETADSPEMLDVALDKATYKPGDTAQLTIASKDGGKALIAVMREGLLAMKQVDIKPGSSKVSFEIGREWMPGAYVAAFLYRPMDERAKRMPGRSLGVRWLGLDKADRTLDVKLTLPAKIGSASTLKVPVKLVGLKPGESAHVTVAAVDVGILALTRFKSPAPEEWFYAQRRLGAEVRDLYGRLIDGMRADRGLLRSGGDGPDGMSMQGSPPVEAPLALFSGVLKAAADGTVTASFDLPDFNGKVRVMAVAWTADKLGHAEGEVIVRDAVAVLASGPRFLTLGDEARLQIDVHNVEGPVGSYRVGVGVTPSEGGARREVGDRTLALKVGERRPAELTIKADSLGLRVYDVSVTGPGGVSVKRKLTFDVKPPASDVRRVTQQRLQPGSRLTIGSDLMSDFIVGRSRATVTVGPTARFDVAGLLLALDRYPYGCAEQTVSRALPLLYANSVATQIGIATDLEARQRVAKAIERLFEMQDSSGAFGVWGPSTPDLWLTAYVTDFLTRARQSGHPVRDAPFKQALDRLQNAVSYAQDFERGGESLAYALYVLARNGRAPVGELRYYSDARLDRFSTALAQAQLGAALAMVGDPERAERAFGKAMQRLEKTDRTALRADYGSFLRDSAAMLTLVAEAKLSRSPAPSLVDVVTKAYAEKALSRYPMTSTQEQAWMLLAARALTDEASRLELEVDGRPHRGALLRSFSVTALSARPLTVTNRSARPTDAVISVMGATARSEPAASNGLEIERSYYTLDGRKVDLESARGGTATLGQNERLVVVLKVTSTGPQGGRLLLVDRLPAGLEIENPRLVASGDIKALDWLKSEIAPEHTEFRDDRFVAAFNLFATRKTAPMTVAYIVRAVTPGSYVHPAAAVEDMYRPERFGRTASGRLQITARK
ncbi:MAG: alpha-2-macroglobulin [Hyphomicrobiaceae bacterium]